MRGSPSMGGCPRPIAPSCSRVRGCIRRPKERAMSEAVVDDIVAVLPPLLQSLEALGFIARHLNPPDFDSVMATAGTPDHALQAVRPRLVGWPAEFAAIQTSLEAASDA